MAADSWAGPSPAWRLCVAKTNQIARRRAESLAFLGGNIAEASEFSGWNRSV